MSNPRTSNAFFRALGLSGTRRVRKYNMNCFGKNVPKGDMAYWCHKQDAFYGPSGKAKVLNMWLGTHNPNAHTTYSKLHDRPFDHFYADYTKYVNGFMHQQSVSGFSAQKSIPGDTLYNWNEWQQLPYETKKTFLEHYTSGGTRKNKLRKTKK